MMTAFGAVVAFLGLVMVAAFVTFIVGLVTGAI